MRVLAIISSFLLLIVCAAAAGYYFFVYPKLSHPAEDTARFLPHGTRVYLSVNLRPGAAQILQAIDILSTFKKSTGELPDKYDELLEEFDDETGINIMQHFLPWIGPEIAMGLVDIGGLSVDIPEAIMLLGTKDPRGTEDFVKLLLDYIEEQREADIEEKILGESTHWSITDDEDGVELHLTIAKATPSRGMLPSWLPKSLDWRSSQEYLVLATTEDLLTDTVSMMSREAISLADNAEFQQARQSVADQRFAMLYVDIDRLIRDVKKLQDQTEAEALDIVKDKLPGSMGVSASFIDMGIRVTQSYETLPDTLGSTLSNQLLSTEVLPADTMALISGVGGQEGWERAKTQIDSFMDDISAIAGQTGLIDEAFGMDFDDLLSEVERETGVNIDDAIFGWMRGEVALSMLPTDIRLDEFGNIEEGRIHVLGMIGLVDRDATEDAKSGLDKIGGFLEDNGLDLDKKVIQGNEAVLANLGEEVDYDPGYLFLEDMVLFGSTKAALVQALEVRDHSIKGLSETDDFKLLLEESSGSPDYVIYANVREITKTIAAALGPSERRDYEEDIAPFVEPIKMFSMVSSVGEETTSFTVLLTFEPMTESNLRPTSKSPVEQKTSTQPTSTPTPYPTATPDPT